MYDRTIERFALLAVGAVALLGTSPASAEPWKPPKTSPRSAQVRIGVGIEASAFVMAPVKSLSAYGGSILAGVKLDRVLVGLAFDYFAPPLGAVDFETVSTTAKRVEVQVALLRSSDARVEALWFGALGWSEGGSYVQEANYLNVTSSFGPWRTGAGVRFWPSRWVGLSATTGVVGYEDEYWDMDGRGSRSAVSLFSRFGVMGVLGW